MLNPNKDLHLGILDNKLKTQSVCPGLFEDAAQESLADLLFMQLQFANHPSRTFADAYSKVEGCHSITCDTADKTVVAGFGDPST